MTDEKPEFSDDELRDILGEIDDFEKEITSDSEQVAEPVAAAEPEPVLESKPEPVLESKPEPVLESEPEPVLESEPEPVLESKPEPVLESKPEPVLESEPAAEAEAEPVWAADQQVEQQGQAASIDDALGESLSEAMEASHEEPAVLSESLKMSEEERHENLLQDEVEKDIEMATAAQATEENVVPIDSSAQEIDSAGQLANELTMTLNFAGQDIKICVNQSQGLVIEMPNGDKLTLSIDGIFSKTA